MKAKTKRPERLTLAKLVERIDAADRDIESRLDMHGGDIGSLVKWRREIDSLMGENADSFRAHKNESGLRHAGLIKRVDDNHAEFNALAREVSILEDRIAALEAQPAASALVSAKASAIANAVAQFLTAVPVLGWTNDDLVAGLETTIQAQL